MTEQMTTRPAASGRGNAAKWYIAIVVAIIVSAGAGLVAGMHIGKASGGGIGAQGAGSMPGMRGNMGEMRGGFGTVTAVSDSSITIESRMTRLGQGDESSQGATATYKITSDTKVTSNGETATIGDVKTGDTVRVETSDSTTDVASAVELNPQMRGGPAMGTRGGGQSSESNDSSQNG